MAPDTPPGAAEPPFPKIPGLTEVRLSLDSQFGRKGRMPTRWTVYADHSGPVAGIPPSNLEITVTGMTLSRLNDEQTAVASQVSFYDQPALMRSCDPVLMALFRKKRSRRRTATGRRRTT